MGGPFTRVDLIGLADGINTYGYAPNALNWVDPLRLAGENVFIHYTDKTGFEVIMKTGVLIQNSQGKVYITDILMTPEDVMRDILIGDKNHLERGKYSIIFRANSTQALNIEKN